MSLAKRGGRSAVCLLVIFLAGHLASVAMGQSGNLRSLQTADQVINDLRELTQKAASSSTGERAKYFSQAQAQLNNWLRLQPQDPQRLLVSAQGAIARSLEAELARQDAELADDDKRWEAARSFVRTAIDAWASLEKDVNAELLRRPRLIRREPNLITPKELTILERNCQLRRAQAFREQALCYPAESADRINALSQSIELLEGIQRAPGNPLAWPARIEEVVCRRLSGDRAAVEKLLAQLQAEPCPEEYRPALAAERLRFLLSTNLAQAKALALSKDLPTSADLELARLDVLITTAAAESASEEASRLRQAAIEQVKQIREAYPGYAARRAEKLAIAQLLNADETLGTDTLLRQAEVRAVSVEWQQALAAYDRAALDAQNARAPEQAFKYSLAAAQLAADNKQWQEAVRRFRETADTHASLPHAAEAHLLAVYYAGVLGQQQQPADTSEYRQMIDEHLARWPSGKSAQQCQWWLARLKMLDQKWDAAIALLEKLPAGNPRFPELQDRLLECRKQELNRLEAADDRDKALPLAELLLESHAGDGDLQEQYARLLAGTKDREELAKALSQWISVQRKSKPGSPRWFRAIYGVAEIQHRLGKSSQARSLIKITEFSYPNFGGAAMKEKFDVLLQACEN